MAFEIVVLIIDQTLQPNIPKFGTLTVERSLAKKSKDINTFSVSLQVFTGSFAGYTMLTFTSVVFLMFHL